MLTGAAGWPLMQVLEGLQEGIRGEVEGYRQQLQKVRAGGAPHPGWG